jgi:hypothetical protein
MVISFALGDAFPDMTVIPLQLNIMFNNVELFYSSSDSQFLARKPVGDFFTGEWGVLLKKHMEGSNGKCFVIDMAGIEGNGKAFEGWDGLGADIVFVNCGSLIVNSIKSYYKEALTAIDAEKGIYSNKKLKCLKQKREVKKFEDCVCSYYDIECAKRLHGEGIDNGIQINSSSNIYSNVYIDIRKLFSKGDNMNIFIYGLYRKIRELKDLEFGSFVVVSNNGEIIANILSYIFHKEVLYMMNLGPKIALSNKDLRSKIKKGGRYLYICDFICLGNELKTLDMLLKIHGAKLVYAMGIAQLLPSNRYGSTNCKVDSLVKLQDYTDMFDYRISLSQKDLQ